MSKGSGRRPAVVDEQLVADNWAAIFAERQRDQQWIESNRAANLAAAEMVTPTGSQKDLSDGHSDEKWPKAAC